MWSQWKQMLENKQLSANEHNILLSRSKMVGGQPLDHLEALFVMGLQCD